MSLERIKNLFDDASRNAELMSELHEAESIDTFLTVAQSNGYDFTAEELARVVQAAVAGEGELSDEQLEAVSGGTSFPTLQQLYPDLLHSLAKSRFAPLKPAEFNIGMPPSLRDKK